MRTLLALTVTLLVLGGCSSSAKSTTPTTPSTTNTPSTTTAGTSTAGSEKCAEAMVNEAVLAHASGPDAAAAEQKTLTDCTSRAQWLSVAAEFTSAGPGGCVVCGGAKAASVLADFCKQANDAPACRP